MPHPGSVLGSGSVLPGLRGLASPRREDRAGDFSSYLLPGTGRGEPCGSEQRGPRLQLPREPSRRWVTAWARVGSGWQPWRWRSGGPSLCQRPEPECGPCPAALRAQAWGVPGEQEGVGSKELMCGLIRVAGGAPRAASNKGVKTGRAHAALHCRLRRDPSSDLKGFWGRTQTQSGARCRPQGPEPALHHGCSGHRGRGLGAPLLWGRARPLPSSSGRRPGLASTGAPGGCSPGRTARRPRSLPWSGFCHLH